MRTKIQIFSKRDVKAPVQMGMDYTSRERMSLKRSPIGISRRITARNGRSVIDQRGSRSLRLNAPIGLSQDKKDQIKEMKAVRDEKKAERKAAKKEAKAAKKEN